MNVPAAGCPSVHPSLSEEATSCVEIGRKRPVFGWTVIMCLNTANILHEAGIQTFQMTLWFQDEEDIHGWGCNPAGVRREAGSSRSSCGVKGGSGTRCAVRGEIIGGL